MPKKVLLFPLLLFYLLGACDDYEPYRPAPTVAMPTRTKQASQPPPTWTPKPPPTQTPQKDNPYSDTDEISGGGKPDDPGPTPPTASLTVQNRTTDVICDLYVWPYNTAFTNQDLLGDGRLNPGQSYTPTGPSGYFHLLVITCDGYEIRRDTNLMGTMIWKLYYFPK